MPIDTLFDDAPKTLAPLFSRSDKRYHGEHHESRLRGLLVIAVSNKKTFLTTGNKSELAVGYCTLYGNFFFFFFVLLGSAYCCQKNLYKIYLK